MPLTKYLIAWTRQVTLIQRPHLYHHCKDSEYVTLAIDYVELEVLVKQPVLEGHSDLPWSPLKIGDKSYH